MKKKIFPIVVLAALVGLTAAGCTWNVALGFGSGPMVDQDYAFTDFDSIEVTSAFEYEIYYSESYSVTGSIRENLINGLDIRQVGNTVKVGLKPGSYSNADARVVISLPVLKKLEVSSASRGSVSGFESGADFDLKVSGASRLEIDMAADKITANISGASKVTGSMELQAARFIVTGASRCDLTGSAGRVMVEAAGASRVDMSGFVAQGVDVNISGASRATVNTNGDLSVEMSGASTLDYLGKPSLNLVSITGASRILNR
jgi:hypothetical protein